MVWFMSWATDWSQTSNYLQHAYIHWMTRGLCKLWLLPCPGSLRTPF